nr:hypothetical protein CFP56_50699 [Quercus suber]
MWCGCAAKIEKEEMGHRFWDMKETQAEAILLAINLARRACTSEHLVTYPVAYSVVNEVIFPRYDVGMLLVTYYSV